MQDKIRVNTLLDFYSALLTKKQNTVCDYYYRDDMSLQEISELEGISRAGVHDLLKRTEASLERYEEKLHMVESFQKRYAYYQEMVSVGNQKINKLVQLCLDTEGGKYE